MNVVRGAVSWITVLATHGMLILSSHLETRSKREKMENNHSRYCFPVHNICKPGVQ
jgi:hypothetical protein